MQQGVAFFMALHAIAIIDRNEKASRENKKKTIQYNTRNIKMS